jgi:predicted nucleic acid-binding protein
MAYVDTCVLVAVYCPEALSAAVQAAIQADPEPTISSLTEVEFVSALAMKTRMGELDPAAATLIQTTFRRHLDDEIYRRVAIESPHYHQAAAWIGTFDTPLRTLDALHLAAAHVLGQPLLTADRALARAAAHLGVDCELIT